MLDKIDLLGKAGALAQHAAHRQALVSNNIANADTPGFRPSDLVTFGELQGSATTSALRQSRPGHAAGQSSATTRSEAAFVDGPGSPNGNSVSIEAEMVRAVDARRQHDLALAVYSSAMGILRSSIGRGR